MSRLIDEVIKFLTFIQQFDSYVTDTALFVAICVVLFFSARVLFKIITGLRLYVFSQLETCQDKTFFTRKYGKWAVISGSSEGIGLAIAEQLARRGMSIVLMSRSEDKLAKAKSKLEDEIIEVGEIITICADLSDTSSKNYDRIKAQIDPDNRDIGVLINNAASYPVRPRPFHEFDMEFLSQMVDLNISATLHLTRMILPGMLNRDRGLIVNVSSLGGLVSWPLLGCYGPTKHFVCAFSRLLQDEYSNKPNIDIICLTPGAVRTNHIARLMPLINANAFIPNAEQYAKCATNALTTRIGSFSGTWAHGLLCELAKTTDRFKLILRIMKVIGQKAKDSAISATEEEYFNRSTKLRKTRSESRSND